MSHRFTRIQMRGERPERTLPLGNEKIYLYVCMYACMYVYIYIYIYIYILMVRRLAFPAPRLPLLPMAWSGRGGGVHGGGGGGMCGELEPQLEVTESAGTLRKP